MSDNGSPAMAPGQRSGSTPVAFHFLTPGYHPDIDGGSYRYAAEIAAELARWGHSVEVITRDPDNRKPLVEIRDGVRIHRVRGGRREANAAAQTLLRKLRASSASTPRILSHHAYFAPASQSEPCEIFYHGPWGLEYAFQCAAKPQNLFSRLKNHITSRVLHSMERRWVRRAVRICTASDYMAQQLRGWHGPLKTGIIRCGGGADLRRFQPSPNRNQLRRQHDAQNQSFVFLAVRRLDPRMGLRELVAAFGPLIAAHPNALLWLAGKGPLTQELTQTIHANGWSNHIRLLGFVPEPDLPGLYAAADAVVMPSLDLEGFGLVTAEATACGTPVIASRSGANAEVLQSLDPGLIFPPGDITALRTFMDGILKGEIRLPERAHVAAWASGRFDWSGPAKGIVGIKTVV